MASHKAESNNTGVMQNTGYLNTDRIAQTLALARPLLDDPELDGLIGDSTLDDILVSCAVLANLLSDGADGGTGLNERELAIITQFLQDQDLMKQFLVAGGPRGNR